MKAWEGKEWEGYIQTLLKRHYRTDYQDVPDQDGGDFGMEGYSLDGCVFQCYAAKEPITTETLKDYQKRKINNDINKFINNKSDLEEIFGGLKIKRWILVVPRSISSDLLKYNEKKSKKVREANLPYVDKEKFKVIIITDKYYKKEIEEIKNSQYMFTDADINTGAISDWKNKEDNGHLFDNLSTKSHKIFGEDKQDKVNVFIDKSIKYYIKGQDLISQSQEYYPDIYERIIQYKSMCEEMLEIDMFLEDDDGDLTFKNVFSKYKRDLKDELKDLSPSQIQTLSYEAVSDWLLRCPLDF